MLFKFLVALALPLASVALPTVAGTGAAAADVAVPEGHASVQGHADVAIRGVVATLPSQQALDDAAKKFGAPVGAIPISVILAQAAPKVANVTSLLGAATNPQTATKLVGDLVTTVNGVVGQLNNLKGVSPDYITLDLDLNTKLSAKGVANLISPILSMILTAVSKVSATVPPVVGAVSTAVGNSISAVSGLVGGVLGELQNQLKSSGGVKTCVDLKMTECLQALGLNASGTGGVSVSV